MAIDLDAIDDGIIDTEKTIADGLGFNENYQKQAIEGIFNILGPSMHQLLTWFDPDYAEDTKNETMNFIDILHWIMNSKWMEYFSEETLQLFGTLIWDATQDDWAKAEKEVMVWGQNKIDYFFRHLKIFDWILVAPQFALHLYERQFGKLQPMNVMFTALPWTLLSPFGVFLQIIFMVFENKFFAEGNVLLLGLQVFTQIQLFSSIFLLWDFDFFLYFIIFRIWRYISLMAAVVFIIAYLISFINTMQLIGANYDTEMDWQKTSISVVDSDLGSDTTWAVYDLLMVMVNAYMDVYLIPTLIINIVIVLKEMTLKQWAFTREDDFEDGTFFGLFDISWLALFGLHQDDEYFNNWIKEFMQEYV